MNNVIKICFTQVIFSLACNAFAGTYEGGSGEPNDPFRIKTAVQFDSIRCHEEDWDKHFLLMDNINISGFHGCEFSNIIGYGANPFTGVFDGGGYTISGFEYSDYGGPIGLFGVVENGEIKNLGLIDPNMISPTQGMAGLLVGAVGNNGQVSNCYVTGGSVQGEGFVGGLVGWLRDGTIANCGVLDTKVNGLFHVGGLVGVSGTYSVGQSAGNLIVDCYADCNVIGDSQIGGLVGHLGFGEIVKRSNATGTVQGELECGGLIGWMWDGVIENCYATGFVYGTEKAGGLVGKNQLYSTFAIISNCYAVGVVEGSQYPVGGLVADNSGYVVHCFWDVESTGQSTSGGGTGLPTSLMQVLTTFTDAGWDFVGEDPNGTNDIWRMCEDGIHYPHLFHQYNRYGDFACPDGVGMDDMRVLSNNWLSIDELDPNFTYPCDPTFDGIISLPDFGILSDHWLE